MCKNDKDPWEPLAKFLGEMIVKYWDELKDSLEELETSSENAEGDEKRKG